MGRSAFDGRRNGCLKIDPCVIRRELARIHSRGHQQSLDQIVGHLGAAEEVTDRASRAAGDSNRLPSASRDA